MLSLWNRFPETFMYRLVTTFALMILLWPWGPALSAQSVRGRLVEEGGGAAIEGAVVVLLDEAGDQSGGMLTDAEGRFHIRAPMSGRYRLRAERVGYATTVSPAFDLAVGEARQIDLRAPMKAIALTGIQVTGRSRCEVRPRDGKATARIWEEARKVLAATALAHERKLLRYETSLYERELSPEDLRVRAEARRPGLARGDRPFVSLPVEELAARGFVHPAENGRSYDYYAPDAPVLLSDAFLDTHCFRLAEHPDSAGLIGLAFEPVRGRRLPEIRGTFWLDRQRAALRFLEYRYTNLRLGIPMDHIGGRVEFDRAPGGAWIVRRWYIRMPEVGVRRTSWRGQSLQRRELTLIREEGGEVVRVRTAGGQGVDMGARASLSGVVYDSTRAAPLAGATVSFAGTKHRARTDAEGRFRIRGVPEGRYSVRFTHPRLDSLGVGELPARVVVLGPDEPAEVRLAVPPLARILANACPATGRSAWEVRRLPGAEVGILVGTVRDSLTGEPIPGATVTAQWNHYGLDNVGRWTVVREGKTGFGVRSDGRGRYWMCEVPARIPVTLQAHFDGQGGPRVEVKLEKSTPTSQDLLLTLLPHMPRVPGT
jgi:hypothetical protein